MDLKFGVHEHSKSDKKYRVIGVVKHSETLEELVVYEALYENNVSKLWARPIDLFVGEVDVEGKRVPRFKYFG